MTYLQMQTWCRRRLKWDSNDSTSNALIQDALKEVYQEVNVLRPWRLLEATSTSVTLSGSTTSVDWPSAWLPFPLYVGLLDSDDASWELTPLDRAEAGASDESVLTRGTPYHYIMQTAASGTAGARKLQIVPIPLPETTYTMRLQGWVSPSDFSADTDVPWWPTNLHHLVPYLATARLMATEAGFEKAADRLEAYGQGIVQRLIDLDAAATSPTKQVAFME